jgi:hypothetical protein
VIADGASGAGAGSGEAAARLLSLVTNEIDRAIGADGQDVVVTC